MMPRGGRLSESATPDRCKNSIRATYSIIYNVAAVRGKLRENKHILIQAFLQKFRKPSIMMWKYCNENSLYYHGIIHDNAYDSLMEIDIGGNISYIQPQNFISFKQP